MWEMTWAKNFLPLAKKRRREEGGEEESAAAFAKKMDLDRGLITSEQVRGKLLRFVNGIVVKTSGGRGGKGFYFVDGFFFWGGGEKYAY